IIPGLTVSERYDSNIFNRPKSLLAPDSKPEDFVTTVVPQLNIAHTGSLMSGSVFGGGLITRYLNNPALDFTGYNAGGNLDLTNAANRVSQRITSLSVIGTYVHTPFGTGFGATPGGLGTGFGSTSGGVLNAGLVTNRASRDIYTLGVTGGYQLTGTTTLTGGYTFSKVSFGEQSGGANTPLFDTTGHQGMTTISTQISARDTVGATATLSHFIQEQSSGGSGQGTFTTISETLNWSRQWTREFDTVLAGGGVIKLPVGSDIPGQSVKLQVVPTVRAAMNYSSFSGGLRDTGSSKSPFDGLPLLPGTLNPGGMMAPGAYTATMSYTYSIFPSYAFGAGPMNSHVVGAMAVGGITSNLSGQVGLNFAHSTRSVPSTTFDTIGATIAARYLIGPVLASLSYNWLFFSNSTDQTSSNQSSDYEFSKKVVLLAFSYAYSSESFFRIGEWGGMGTQGSVGGTSAPSGAGTGGSSSGAGSGILRKE
ncbi:MAG: hypothetical protein ACRD5H_12660, partial [Nitrososphaerales archaeon]